MIGIRNRTIVYIKFAKNNVREIKDLYSKIRLFKSLPLFTMKVENHHTTKVENQHGNLLKREIQIVNNIKLC